jgi:hypothetical protein
MSYRWVFRNDDRLYVTRTFDVDEMNLRCYYECKHEACEHFARCRSDQIRRFAQFATLSQSVDVHRSAWQKAFIANVSTVAVSATRMLPAAENNADFISLTADSWLLPFADL